MVFIVVVSAALILCIKCSGQHCMLSAAFCCWTLFSLHHHFHFRFICFCILFHLCTNMHKYFASIVCNSFWAELNSAKKDPFSNWLFGTGTMPAVCSFDNNGWLAGWLPDLALYVRVYCILLIWYLHRNKWKIKIFSNWICHGKIQEIKYFYWVMLIGCCTVVINGKSMADNWSEIFKRLHD